MQLTSRKVLVVDDNVDQAATQAFLLTLSGNEVQVANDGPSAIEAALRFRPEFVLLDLGLPRMDGYEVARILRSEPALTQMRIVAVTGYGDEHHRRRCQALGFNEHLLKPVDPLRLDAILRSVVVKK